MLMLQVSLKSTKDSLLHKVEDQQQIQVDLYLKGAP